MQVRVSFISGSAGGSSGCSGGLVAACGVERELAEDFAGGGVDDSDLEVGDSWRGIGVTAGAEPAAIPPLGSPARARRVLETRLGDRIACRRGVRRLRLDHGLRVTPGSLL